MVTLVANGRGYPTFSICGIITDPIAEVSATDDPEMPLADLMKVIPGPDFPTGGQICGRRGIVEAYATGRGAITMRGKVEVEEQKGGRKTLVISEVPYMVLRSTITEKIAAPVMKNGKIASTAM